MVRTYTPTKNNISGLDQRRDVGTVRAMLATVRRKVRIPPFWLHFVEMFAAMWVGMVVGVPVYLAITGLSSYSQGLRLHPVPSVSAMAISMALPMAAWMLFRGHGWRNSAEMAAAMIVPAIPFVILAGLGVISGTACRAYMPLSIVAMIGLMVYRRTAYSMPMPAPWRRHPKP
jgi:hypothetical protein